MGPVLAEYFHAPELLRLGFPALWGSVLGFTQDPLARHVTCVQVTNLPAHCSLKTNVLA